MKELEMINGTQSISSYAVIAKVKSDVEGISFVLGICPLFRLGLKRNFLGVRVRVTVKVKEGTSIDDNCPLFFPSKDNIKKAALKFPLFPFKEYNSVRASYVSGVALDTEGITPMDIKNYVVDVYVNQLSTLIKTTLNDVQMVDERAVKRFMTNAYILLLNSAYGLPGEEELGASVKFENVVVNFDDAVNALKKKIEAKK